MSEISTFWQGRRVLVVDDFEMVRSTVCKVLRSIKCDFIDEAENGDVALKKMNEAVEAGNPYDLVLSDWVMPIVTGLELFERLTVHPKLKTTPFVMLTVEADPNTVKLALSKGIKHFMVKPVDKDKLLEKLREIESEISLQEKKRKYNV